MPRLSVVIPAYNAAGWIAETLQSVLAQTFTDFEIIVVNDGSTDDTGAVISRFNQVQCLSKSNGGIASARNAGIKQARGEYIAFVDADDLWSPDKLRLQMDKLTESGCAWAYSDAYAFDNSTRQILFVFGKMMRLYAGDVLEPLFIRDFIPSPTPIVKRSIFEDVGFFDESPTVRQGGEDWDMWLRIGAKYPLALVNQPLAWYRVHNTSKARSEDQFDTLATNLNILERAVQREPQRLARLKNRAVTDLCLRTGRVLVRQGALPEARRLFGRAIKQSPASFAAYGYWLGTLVGKPIINLYIQILYKIRQFRATR